MGKVLTEILAIDGGDGLEFDPDGMTSEDIREESGYPCQRFTIPYRFGAKHTHFIKLDLSFGDPVTPEPQAIAVHPILEDFQGGTVLGYPVETLLAEKIETMVVRGLANTRSKDLFDLWVLSRTQTDLHLNAVGGPLVHGPIHGMPRSLRRVEVVVSLSKLRLLTSCPYSSEQASETLDLRGHLRTTGQKKSDQQLWLPIA